MRDTSGIWFLKNSTKLMCIFRPQQKHLSLSCG